MWHKLRSITHSFRIPAMCPLCHMMHLDAFAVCDGCKPYLKRIGAGCVRCQTPLLQADSVVCGHCIQHPPAFDRVITAYSYEEPLSYLLKYFKYHDGLYLRNWLVQLMWDALPSADYAPDCLVPVPMYKSKLRQRGFNQAHELAKGLGKRLLVPVFPKICQKIRPTTPQVMLGRAERQRQLAHAFIASSCTYQHVTLIDDLLTTGGTAHALAVTLKKQGVKQVDVWCVARTP